MGKKKEKKEEGGKGRRGTGLAVNSKAIQFRGLQPIEVLADERLQETEQKMPDPLGSPVTVLGDPGPIFGWRFEVQSDFDFMKPTPHHEGGSRRWGVLDDLGFHLQSGLAVWFPD